MIIVNSDPFGQGWLFKVSGGQLGDDLMDRDAYLLGTRHPDGLGDVSQVVFDGSNVAARERARPFEAAPITSWTVTPTSSSPPSDDHD
jgi:hypothetical protein